IIPEIGAMRGCRQPEPHRFTVLEHSLRALGGADRILASLHRLRPFGDDLTAHLAEPLGGSLERRDVLKLAAFLHDISKPETRPPSGASHRGGSGNDRDWCASCWRAGRNSKTWRRRRRS